MLSVVYAECLCSLLLCWASLRSASLRLFFVSKTRRKESKKEKKCFSALLVLFICKHPISIEEMLDKCCFCHCWRLKNTFLISESFLSFTACLSSVFSFFYLSHTLSHARIICLSICLSLSLSVCHFKISSFIYRLSIFHLLFSFSLVLQLCIYLSAFLFFRTSFIYCLFIFHFLFFSISLAVSLTVYLSVCLSVCHFRISSLSFTACLASVFSFFLYLSYSLIVCLPICLSFSLSFQDLFFH
jgi:hypothetical protein